MSVPQSVATIVREHVTLELESIDRLYRNVSVPQVHRAQGVVSFFRYHRGATVASSALMEPITAAFVSARERFTTTHGVPLLTVAPGQRKDAVAATYLAQCTGEDGVLFIGKAQETTPVVRTQGRRPPQTGQRYAWIVTSTALVTASYIYGVDRDFGPFFLQFCSDFPDNAAAVSQRARVPQAPGDQGGPRL